MYGLVVNQQGVLVTACCGKILSQCGCVKRPRPNVETAPVFNIFCKTGQGGGIDPTCGTGKGGSGTGPGAAKPAPKTGDSVTFDGKNYTVTGGGMTARRGPNKGREPLVLTDSAGNKRVAFADQVAHASSQAKGGSAAPKQIEQKQKEPKDANKGKGGDGVRDKEDAAARQKAKEKDDAAELTPRYEPVGTGTVDVSKTRDKSIKILDSLPKEQRDEIIGYMKKPGHVLKKVPLSQIKPSQHGEDRINDSSKESAKTIKTGDLSQIQKADLAPIRLDKDGKIIDGNHRYSAAEMNKQKFIYALVPVADAPPTVNMRNIVLRMFSTRVGD